MPLLFVTIHLIMGLTEKDIRAYLNQKGISREKIRQVFQGDSLIKVLRVPLFLIMFCSLEPGSDALTRGEILHQYFHQKTSSLPIYTARSRILQIDEDVSSASSIRQVRRISIVGCNGDGWICRWNSETLKRGHSRKIHEDLIFSIEFSEDGRLLLTASSDGTVKPTDIDTLELIRSLEIVSGLEIQGCDLRSMDPDSRFSDNAEDSSGNIVQLYERRKQGEKKRKQRLLWRCFLTL